MNSGTRVTKVELNFENRPSVVEVQFRTFLADVPNVASMATPLLWPNFNIISFCQGVCIPRVKGTLST